MSLGSDPELEKGRSLEKLEGTWQRFSSQWMLRIIWPLSSFVLKEPLFILPRLFFAVSLMTQFTGPISLPSTKLRHYGQPAASQSRKERNTDNYESWPRLQILTLCSSFKEIIVKQWLKYHFYILLLHPLSIYPYFYHSLTNTYCVQDPWQLKVKCPV